MKKFALCAMFLTVSSVAVTQPLSASASWVPVAAGGVGILAAAAVVDKYHVFDAIKAFAADRPATTIVTLGLCAMGLALWLDASSFDGTKDPGKSVPSSRFRRMLGQLKPVGDLCGTLAFITRGARYIRGG